MKYTKLNNTYFATPKDNLRDLIEVEIGDSKQPDKFYPQVKICRWGNKDGTNECNVSIRLVSDDLKDKKPKLEDGKIKVKGYKTEAHFYEITEGEGATEFEIVLKEKPDTNILTFTLEDKDVSYLYQPALTQEEIDEGAERPENVEGSYAVYAKTPKINWTGGKEYKVGKVGHIYRPKIIDAEGKEVWGELHIENKVLTVTIPQDFLDSAVYPIRHAAGLTFGYTGAGGSSNVWSTNILPAFAHATGAAGTGVSMSISIDGTHSTINTQMCLYNADLNKVTNGVTNENVSTPTAKHWETQNFTSAPTLTAQTYHLAFWTDSVGPLTNWIDMYFDDDASYTVWQDTSSTYKTWPDPIEKDTTDSGHRLSFYATYTASGGTVSYSGSASTSPSGSGSASESKSLSQSESGSYSASKSGSKSESKSLSFSASESKSLSQSASESKSASKSESKSASASESKSGSKSLSESMSGSFSGSKSESKSVSASGSASLSFSASESKSASKSESKSESKSGSASLSFSASESKSISASESKSASKSESKSLSQSGSFSLSPSESGSESVSPSGAVESESESASGSKSGSASGSRSLSQSASVSASGSASGSKSESKSLSPSGSGSKSESASPSVGYEGYTRGDEADLPANDTDLETPYTPQDYLDVDTNDGVRVEQTATQQYMIHQFKDFVGDANACTLEWEGQTSLAPTSSTVYLQIYNQLTTTWDEVDTDGASSADTDFTLTGIVADTTNYKDTQKIISCRVYQLST